MIYLLGPIGMRRPCRPLIAHPSAVGHVLKGLTGLWDGGTDGGVARPGGSPRRRAVGHGAPVQGAGIASLHARARMSLLGASGCHNGTDIRPGDSRNPRYLPLYSTHLEVVATVRSLVQVRTHKTAPYNHFPPMIYHNGPLIASQTRSIFCLTVAQDPAQVARL